MSLVTILYCTVLFFHINVFHLGFSYNLIAVLGYSFHCAVDCMLVKTVTEYDFKNDSFFSLCKKKKILLTDDGCMCQNLIINLIAD